MRSADSIRSMVRWSCLAAATPLLAGFGGGAAAGLACAVAVVVGLLAATLRIGARRPSEKESRHEIA